MKKKLLTEQEAEQELNRLTNEMPPDDIKISLKLDDNSTTRQEVLNSVAIAVSDLQAFINNGHKLEGLPLDIDKRFTSVECITQDGARTVLR